MIACPKCGSSDAKVGVQLAKCNSCGNLDNLAKFVPAPKTTPAIEQNQRIREWFETRTGMKNATLSEHMAFIDKMLGVHLKKKRNKTKTS